MTVEVTGIAKTKRKLDEIIRKKHVGVMIYLDRNLVSATPKDTGRAQTNWIASIKNPTRAINNSLTAPQNGGVMSKIKPYSVSFMCNNLKYIDRLNNGWSSQNKVKNWVLKISKAAAKNV
jgi:hypothetical protein